MKLLAMDSSGLVASVALVEDDVTIAEYSVNYKKTHSQTLLPMLDEIARMIDLDLSTIDALAIAAGPGSFTGLRIGSATVKGLGLALGKPVISVPTLDAMAYNAYGMSGLICPMMDARRNQVFTGVYRFTEAELLGEEYAQGEFGVEKTGAAHTEMWLESVLDQTALDINELIELLNGYGEPVVFLGDAVPLHRELIGKTMQVPYSFAPAHMNRQRASAVAALALSGAGECTSAAEHKPEYLRVSQAEREKAEREGCGSAVQQTAEPEVRQVLTGTEK